uniref:WD_REPEATS_REGION domain-containing protein n=1 Tax=Syphacia muris TaxID=451379 RepID=A0A0N5AXR2_9BILA
MAKRKADEGPSVAKSATETNHERQIDDYDSSDEEGVRNTVGNIPLSWYADCVHIGYDRDGQRIMKKPKKDEMDLFLEKVDDPDYWVKVFDRNTGDFIKLSDEQIDQLTAISSFRYPLGYNPYEPFYDLYSSEVEIHPMSNGMRSKSSFLPSRSEARIVSKMVHSIKMGWMNQPAKEKKKVIFDPWAEETEVELSKSERARLRMHFAAPKVDLPGHAESYNPPAEYLFTDEELKKYNDTDPEDRRMNFIPQKYSCYRKVPAYDKFYNDRYERCLDLYLAPRKQKMKLNVELSQLLPELPKKEDLRPFPTTLAFYMRGHSGQVRSLSFEPSCGELLASGGEDCTLRLWSVSSGHCVKVTKFDSSITCVAYSPVKNRTIIALTLESKQLILLNAGCGDNDAVRGTEKFLRGLDVNKSSDESVLKWNRVPKVEDQILINLPHMSKQVVWHANGNYLASCSQEKGPSAIFIHYLPTCKTQTPFARIKGTVTCVLFHPTLPQFFVATRRYVRVYDLKKCTLLKKVMTASHWVSCITTDGYGNNIFLGGLDRVFSWIDLDFSLKPWRSYRHHHGAVRAIARHARYPLLATVSDDGAAIVYYARVSTDFEVDNQLVPVKKLFGHSSKGNLGVLCTVFHPTQPWLVTAGADGLIALFSY